MTYLRNVSTLELKGDLCIGCGNCLDVCPHNVFDLSEGKAIILDKDRCMECGACMINCPVDALSVEKGVGCAYAVIESRLKGRDEISCGCDGGDQKDCCC